MAKAVKETVITETVVLTLSIREAGVLRELCRTVAGDPDTTVRGITDSIDEAICDAGIETVKNCFTGVACAQYE